MNSRAVESATLLAIGYDDAREVLELEFRSHVVYRYFGVAGPVYEELVAAPSKGRYFNRHFSPAVVEEVTNAKERPARERRE